MGQYLSPFGHLLNAFLTAPFPAQVFTGSNGPVLDNNSNWRFIGAPHFYRILDFVHVPSRFVGTDEILNAEIFNDVPGTSC
ncbi:MAG: hypothetical protein HGA94_04005 [Candidatus Aminicenantes bacterium]|nr:hypothetical protein [Candidatus Aminicenantes bacterium]